MKPEEITKYEYIYCEKTGKLQLSMTVPYEEMSTEAKRYARLSCKGDRKHLEYSTCVFFHYSRYKWICLTYFPLTKKMMAVIEYNFKHQYKLEIWDDNSIRMEYENRLIRLSIEGIKNCLDIVRQIDKYVDKESRSSVHYMKIDNKEINYLEYGDIKGVRIKNASIKDIFVEINKRNFQNK